VFDATHSVQLPSAAGGVSGGERQYVALLARAATAAGVDGVFLETHPSPENALCDAASQWPLSGFEGLMRELGELHAVRAGRAIRP
ncbi:MAG TPA: 3-deoxy-8-phosphooctulonate synthase, partial [Gemmatimonadota bacterium]|nr:3-deoxy-8-phosphooctulonate synthase [Gemmatimonadota bacterium]